MTLFDVHRDRPVPTSAEMGVHSVHHGILSIGRLQQAGDETDMRPRSEPSAVV